MASKRSKRSKRRSPRKSGKKSSRKGSKRRSKRRSPKKSTKRGSSKEDRCYTVAGSNFKPLVIKGKSGRDKLVKSLRSKGKKGINSFTVRCRPHYKRTPTRYAP